MKVKRATNQLQLRVILSLFSFFCFQFVIFSQTVENVKAIVKQDVILITYDLIGNSDQVFNINLHYSRDSFENPLTLVTGDVGPNVKAGKDKRIEWLAKNELQNFKGSLIFEIRAILPQAAFDPLQFTNFNLSTIKSGKGYQIQWEGGRENENIDLLLFENGKQISKIGSVSNSSPYYRWKIPKGNKSANYQIQLKGESGTVASNQFKIKSGSPILLIGGSALVIAGVVVAVIMLGGDDIPPSNNDLPTPPDPN